MRNTRTAALAVALWALGSGVAQADPEAGQAKSPASAACHGPMGMSTLPDAPNLAGQPEIYLSQQLKVYRSGKRVHEVMSLMAKSSSDDDIADLSGWYASIKVDIREKP